MRIRKVIIKSHPVLKSLILDFTDANDHASNTIILAGENGTGKSTVLDLISDIGNIEFKISTQNSLIEYHISLEEFERVLLTERLIEFQKLINMHPVISEVMKNDLVLVRKTKVGTPEEKTILWQQVNDVEVSIREDFFRIENNINAKFFKVAFSKAEISFTSNRIQSTTTLEVDEGASNLIISSPSIATLTAQLLIDIDALDASDAILWSDQNENLPIPAEVKHKRLKRFTNAFAKIFPTKRLIRISNQNSSKEIIFKEYSNEHTLNELSSGEKQIVFRGSFLLQHQGSLGGGIILIDEPEISLHPKWQENIIDYYRSLFKDENGKQTCQIIFTTHSPIVIQNALDEKIVILKKDLTNGKISVAKKPAYPTMRGKGLIKQAFNMEAFLIDNGSNKIIFVEGKTDKIIIETAWHKLYPNTACPYDFVTAYSSSHIHTILSQQELYQREPSRIFAGLFDFDGAYRDWNQLKNWDIIDNSIHKGATRKNKSGKGLAFLLPVPDFRVNFASHQLGQSSTLPIEFLFEDKLIPSDYIDEVPIPQSSGKNKKFKDSKKDDFSNLIGTYDSDAFKTFRLLFNNFEEKFSVLT